MRTIAYDVVLKQPGCALLQAAFGCDPELVRDFDARVWLLAPTPNMRVYPVQNDEMLQRLVELTNAAHPVAKRP